MASLNSWERSHLCSSSAGRMECLLKLSEITLKNIDGIVKTARDNPLHEIKHIMKRQQTKKGEPPSKPVQLANKYLIGRDRGLTDEFTPSGLEQALLRTNSEIFGSSIESLVDPQAFNTEADTLLQLVRDRLLHKCIPSLQSEVQLPTTTTTTLVNETYNRRRTSSRASSIGARAITELLELPAKSLRRKIETRLNYLRQNPKKQKMLTREITCARKLREEEHKINFVNENKRVISPETTPLSPTRGEEVINRKLEHDMQWMKAQYTKELEREVANKRRAAVSRCKLLHVLMVIGVTQTHFAEKIKRCREQHAEKVKQDWAASVIQVKLLAIVRNKRKHTRNLRGVARITNRAINTRKRNEQRKEEVTKGDAIEKVNSFLNLLVSSVPMRARAACSSFMKRIRIVRRFIRRFFIWKRFGLKLIELQWRRVECTLATQCKSREIQKLRDYLVKFSGWKEQEKRVSEESRVFSIWRENRHPWDQKTFTLISSLVEMKAHLLSDANLRIVAADIGYFPQKQYVTSAAFRHSRCNDELTKRRLAYHHKIPIFRDALLRWKQDKLAILKHITHDVDSVRFKLMNIATAVPKPVPPPWSIIISNEVLHSWVYEGWAHTCSNRIPLSTDIQMMTVEAVSQPIAKSKSKKLRSTSRKRPATANPNSSWKHKSLL